MMERRPHRPSMATLALLRSLLVAFSALLLEVRVEAFSSPTVFTSFSRSNHALIVKGSRRIPNSNNFIHGRSLLFAATEQQVITLKGSATASTKSNGANNKKKPKSKQKQRRKSNGKSNHNRKYKRKQATPKTKKTNTANRNNSNVNINRPYTDLTVDELKQLTEYHLSQTIQPHATVSVGSMASREMHEFSRLISSWSKLNTNVRKEKWMAAEMAEQCLLELIEEKKAGNPNAGKGLTADVYYLVIKAWLKSGSYQDLVHATSLLDLLERMHPVSQKKNEAEGTKRFVASSMKCYVAVLDGWCKSRSTGGEVKAEQVLRRMGGVGKKLGKECRDVRHYNNVMNRIASSGKPNSGGEAERLLLDMIAAYKQNENVNGTTTATTNNNNNGLAPSRNSFNTVIKAYANAGGKHASTNAQRILSLMENPTSIGLEAISKQIMPDKISYTSILMASGPINDAKNGEKVGVQCNLDEMERAEEMLERMLEMYKNGNGDARPDTVTYNAVLKVWGKCGHPDAGERSEALLEKMLELYEAGDPDVIPDDVTFNTVIHNLANSESLDAPIHAMRLLERMEKCHESGLIEARPDIISYNSVLNAFSKKGGPESAQQAEDMLDNLEQRYDSGACNIRPDVYSYNIVISAWGNCGYANRAVALLDRMTAKTNQGKADLKPDATTYNSVLHAWSQSSDRNAPVKALGLLEIIIRLHEGGDRSAKPDVLSFSTVINAFSKSKFPRKARQTRDLLRRMKQLYENGQRNMQPNVYVYAAVLNACAYTFGRTEEKEEALRVGIETYEELQSSPDIQTNHVAYGSFIRVCRRLMPDDSRRNHFITRAFKQCCADGQLGEYVVRQLRAVPKLYETLLQAYIVEDFGEVDYRDLPSSWKCNVKDRKRRKGSNSSSRGRYVGSR